MDAYLDLGVVVIRITPTYFFGEGRHLVCLGFEAPVSTTVCLECGPDGCEAWQGERPNSILDEYPVHHHHEELE